MTKSEDYLLRKAISYMNKSLMYNQEAAFLRTSPLYSKADRAVVRKYERRADKYMAIGGEYRDRYIDFGR